MALSEQIVASAICVCGVPIVQLGTGAWRSDTHPLGDDRIVCTAFADKRHHPRAIPEIPFTTADLP